MADDKVEKGDEVSYPWSGGRPGGTVADISESRPVVMETKNNNEVKKDGEPGNPALYIERSGGHDVVKKASEVAVEEKGYVNQETHIQPEKDKKENGDAKTGEKRSADDEDEKKDEGEAKKQKTSSSEANANGEAPKKKGRPAKGSANGAKKEAKKKAPKRAATESGEPRRSGRNAGK